VTVNAEHAEHVEEELLQRYFDGDLAPSPAASVAQHLQQCAACAQRHRALVALRRAIVQAAEDSARGVDFDAMFARVERGVREQPPPNLIERSSVWWQDRLEQRARALWMPAAGALAAAAVLLLVVRGTLPSGDDAPIAAGGSKAGNPSAAPNTAPEAVPGSEVVQVDFGTNAGTVFEIALDDGNSTPVVWINDGPEQAVE
jgi:anti-sigma factor RsiW